MITMSKFLKIFNAPAEERDRLIDKLSEEDAKALVRITFIVLAKGKVSLDSIDKPDRS